MNSGSGNDRPPSRGDDALEIDDSDVVEDRAVRNVLEVLTDTEIDDAEPPSEPPMTPPPATPVRGSDELAASMLRVLDGESAVAEARTRASVERIAIMASADDAALGALSDFDIDLETFGEFEEVSVTDLETAPESSRRLLAVPAESPSELSDAPVTDRARGLPAESGAHRSARRAEFDADITGVRTMPLAPRADPDDERPSDPATASGSYIAAPVAVVQPLPLASRPTFGSLVADSLTLELPRRQGDEPTHD